MQTSLYGGANVSEAGGKQHSIQNERNAYDRILRDEGPELCSPELVLTPEVVGVPTAGAKPRKGSSQWSPTGNILRESLAFVVHREIPQASFSTPIVDICLQSRTEQQTFSREDEWRFMVTEYTYILWANCANPKDVEKPPF